MKVDTDEHSTEARTLGSSIATIFFCDKLERACHVTQGMDFEYCPFCGQELSFCDIV